jgi:hypothetical protein
VLKANPTHFELGRARPPAHGLRAQAFERGCARIVPTSVISSATRCWSADLRNPSQRDRYTKAGGAPARRRGREVSLGSGTLASASRRNSRTGCSRVYQLANPERNSKKGLGLGPRSSSASSTCWAPRSTCDRSRRGSVSRYACRLGYGRRSSCAQEEGGHGARRPVGPRDRRGRGRGGGARRMRVLLEGWGAGSLPARRSARHGAGRALARARRSSPTTACATATSARRRSPRCASG